MIYIHTHTRTSEGDSQRAAVLTCPLAGLTDTLWAN